MSDRKLTIKLETRWAEEPRIIVKDANGETSFPGGENDALALVERAVLGEGRIVESYSMTVLNATDRPGTVLARPGETGDECVWVDYIWVLS